MENIYNISINYRMMDYLINDLRNNNDKIYYRKIFSIGYLRNNDEIIDFIEKEYHNIFIIIRREIERYIYSRNIEDIEISDLFNYFNDREEIRKKIKREMIFSRENFENDISSYNMIIEFFLDNLEIEYRKIIDL